MSKRITKDRKLHKRVTVLLTEAEARKLAAAAERQNWSWSAVVRQALAQYLEEPDQRQLA